MSNFFVAVGGSGAKLAQSMIHLGAAGLLPAHRSALRCQLVDPDENNGNVEECLELFKAYQQCWTQLSKKLGKTDLLRAAISVEGPWTPLHDGRVDTLKEIFQYEKLARMEAVDADLLELFFDQGELEMSIKQGFRGRPAIGATVLAQSVQFDAEPWSSLKDDIKQGGGNARVLLAGSVFGGSGASGVPTLVRLLREELAEQVAGLELGLILVLPFFQFKPVADEDIQADATAFPTATAEALKYYHERRFLNFCHSIYCVGEEVLSDASISAVGASEQRNEAHFIELIGGLGAMRFFNDQVPSRPQTLAVAGRREEGTITWDDLPYDDLTGGAVVRQLQTMATFAVAYQYLFYPRVREALSRGRSTDPFWVEHVERVNVEPGEAGRAFQAVSLYLEQFLTWLLRISTPRREGFRPGLVNPNAFAVPDAQGWRLKQIGEFNDRDFASLLLSRGRKSVLDTRAVFQGAARRVSDPQVTGPGRLIRAIYDACHVAE